MGIGEDFKNFCSNLTVNNVSDISSRYKTITKRLNTDFWNSYSETDHSYYIGSYGRYTAIRNFHDLDVLFELPDSIFHQYSSHTGNGQSALLQVVKNSILKTYSNTDVGGDGQVVVVRFADDMRFEILPAFTASNNGYLYPNSNNGGSWKLTNPFPEIEAINITNKNTNSNLKELCRMVRAWRRKWEVPIGGLLIDTLADSFIKTWKYRDKSYIYYDWMSRDFFDYLATRNKDQNYWAAPGSGQSVYRKGNFEFKARQCCNISKEAIEYYEKYPSLARSKWRDIYGTFFPA